MAMTNAARAAASKMGPTLPAPASAAPRSELGPRQSRSGRSVRRALSSQRVPLSEILIECQRSVAVIGTQKASSRDLAASLQRQPQVDEPAPRLARLQPRLCDRLEVTHLRAAEIGQHPGRPLEDGIDRAASDVPGVDWLELP